MLLTKRLKLYPADREQMERFIADEKDASLRSAYSEMLAGCIEHPDKWEWYAMWLIELTDGTHIGDLCFKGLSDDGIAEIGYGILPGFQGMGYASETVGAMTLWAFEHPEVTAVEAETEPDNAASQRVLEKCGFIPDGTFGEEGPRFVLKRS